LRVSSHTKSITTPCVR